MRRAVVAISTIGWVASAACGQLRVVQYNTAGSVRPGLSTVLEQIGHTGVNGIAMPIDVLVVEEQASSSAVDSLVATLNGIYGPGTYVAAPYTGITSGGGLPAMVYRPTSVSLIGSPVGIGSVSTSANARQTIRYQLRPNGYGADADLYVYASHMKASSGGTNAGRRAVEAASNRADADSLGSGKNVLFIGDFNLYSGNEVAYTTLLSPGPAQAYDVSGASAAWSGTANRIYHTQSPATTAAYSGQVTGGVNDRFDFQLITANLNDGHGLAYIPGSYHVFGNNGTHPVSAAINSDQNTWDNAGLTVPRSAVLDALTTATDHLPVIADYQLPAKMGVAISTPAPVVIAGAAVNVAVTVSNTAAVLTAAGADQLHYTVSGAGAVSGGSSGTVLATQAGQVVNLSFETSTAGIKSGTISAVSDSQAAANATYAQPLAVTVLGHANPSFSMSADVAELTIDFGIRMRGVPVTAPVTIYNRADPTGLTARLDLDSIEPGIGAGISMAQTKEVASATVGTVSLNTTSLGPIDATVTILTSDEDLPGAVDRDALGIRVLGTVADGGDTNLDGKVDITDLAALAGAWQTPGGWTHGDFNRDGFVDIADLSVLASNWQLGTGSNLMSLPSLLDSFQLPSPVPEPTSLAALAIGAILARRPSKTSFPEPAVTNSGVS